ncbi:carboxylate-amine ligase [Singulisphaera acidiphila]|uniref:Putative glutamate--cysteine ligase 2 n=1 Tax=Singulisphaera acidiphila (strain ATCC BAA-1392 / DSM 18658 / VKM B-2454 / MOB10) TaxID=886293 RepID=L0DLM2_SINAD|nr:carboxylate-amine ligase [Singulisphaera acidiphila]AGA29743.1 carboxylate-amine ligase, YbdK family [Singulisphaera acidiphila DSM 18658]
MGQSIEDFTIGVEEEYQIVNPETRELRQRAQRILLKAQETVGEDVTNELFLSQIEIGTPVCKTLGEVRAELVRLRSGVIHAAQREGSRIVAAGTHPFSHWENQAITPKPRYYGIAADFQQLAREQIIFGCHVHVGISDRELAIQVMNRARPWLAPLLALTANSPFWLGMETGYSSYRTELFQRFPMVGTPHVLASRTEYDDLVSALVETGSISDGSKIYWDIRPSSHFETLEFRVTDVCASIDEAVMVAGLCRALARTCYAQAERGLPIEHARPELLRAAKWRASRYGLDGELIDIDARLAVPAAQLIEKFLEFLRPTLEEAGEWDEIDTLVRETLKRGTGAKRQRDVFAQHGRFEDVVDFLIDETARGTAP